MNPLLEKLTGYIDAAIDRMESLCDKAYNGGAITAKQLAKLDSLQADCMIERGVL